MAALTDGIHHLGLTVSDLDAAREFFIGPLGHEVAEGMDAEPACFVSDGATIIALWQAEGGPKVYDFDRHRNVGLHHAAFLVKTENLAPLFDAISHHPGVRIEAELGRVSKDIDASHFMVVIPGGPRIEFICSPSVHA